MDNNWIKVSDMLPGNDRAVFVLAIVMDNTPFYGVMLTCTNYSYLLCRYIKEANKWEPFGVPHVKFMEYLQITHWRELPEVPFEQGDRHNYLLVGLSKIS